MCSSNAVTAVQRLVIMGGNESHNEYTSTGAEFNFYCDPDAADLVIRKVRPPACTLSSSPGLYDNHRLCSLL